MNHSLGRASVAELTEGGEGVLAQARQTLDSAIAARASALKRHRLPGWKWRSPPRTNSSPTFYIN